MPGHSSASPTYRCVTSCLCARNSLHEKQDQREHLTCRDMKESENVSCSVMSDCLCSHGQYPPGFSVCGILQARILERVAIPFSRGSSRPRDGTQFSCIAGRFFTIWDTREARVMVNIKYKDICKACEWYLMFDYWYRFNCYDIFFLKIYILNDQAEMSYHLITDANPCIPLGLPRWH